MEVECPLSNPRDLGLRALLLHGQAALGGFALQPELRLGPAPAPWLRWLLLCDNEAGEVNNEASQRDETAASDQDRLDRKLARADLVANMPWVIPESARTLLNAEVEDARKLAGDVGGNTLPNEVTDVHRNAFLCQWQLSAFGLRIIPNCVHHRCGLR